MIKLLTKDKPDYYCNNTEREFGCSLEEQLYTSLHRNNIYTLTPGYPECEGVKLATVCLTEAQEEELVDLLDVGEDLNDALEVEAEEHIATEDETPTDEWIEDENGGATEIEEQLEIEFIDVELT